ISAAASTTPDEFIERLHAAGVLVKVRRSTIDPDVLTGYAVALPGHKSKAGDFVYYSGGKLAADLSLPKLRQRWGTQSGTVARPQPCADRERRIQLLHQATAAVRRAAEEIRGQATSGAVAQAGSDVLTTVIRASSGSRAGRLWAAAECFDRAVRERHGQPGPDTFRARQLRALSGQLAKAGRISGRSDHRAALQLLDSLARLSDSVAERRRAQQRLHQADSAQRAGATLREHAADGVQPQVHPMSAVSGRERASRVLPHPPPQQHRSR
ncbi:MAG: relaxase, partial [Longispora sp.]|nr:relaxase [Longispora sp. (in: high G+C Gram-positive bacteria)]